MFYPLLSKIKLKTKKGVLKKEVLFGNKQDKEDRMCERFQGCHYDEKLCGGSPIPSICHKLASIVIADIDVIPYLNFPLLSEFDTCNNSNKGLE